MTEDAPPNPEAVRDALDALAAGTAPTETATFRDTVADATAATDCAVEALSFLRAGRLSELARAVADAEAADATTTAERGRRALGTLRRLDAAARSPDDAASSGGATTAGEGSDSNRRPDDHFHRARGTVLPPTGQRTDR